MDSVPHGQTGSPKLDPNGRPPGDRPNRRLRYGVLAGVVVLAALILWGALCWGSNTPDLDAGPAFPMMGRMPPDFDTDASPEANAFRLTCSQCHVLPSPSLYNEAGWRQVRAKMSAQIEARGMKISDEQLDLAIRYAILHGRSSKANAPAVDHPDAEPDS